MKKYYCLLGLLFISLNACMSTKAKTDVSASDDANVNGAISTNVNASANISANTKKAMAKCDTSLQLENEVMQCYRQEITSLLTRKINASLRGLTLGDWPFNYEFVYEVSLTPNGTVRQVDIIKISTSHRLNKALSKTMKNTAELPVPQNDLFDKGSFEKLKVMIVPARTPLLGEEKIIDHHIIMIYLTETCSARSDRC